MMWNSKLFWPEFKFPPINLWSVPCITLVEYTERVSGSKSMYSTRIVPNPLYTTRNSHG